MNPIRFGPNEDFDAYPRDFECDEKLCRGMGVDILFDPISDNMYLDSHRAWGMKHPFPMIFYD